MGEGPALQLAVELREEDLPVDAGLWGLQRRELRLQVELGDVALGVGVGLRLVLGDAVGVGLALLQEGREDLAVHHLEEVAQQLVELPVDLADLGEDGLAEVGVGVVAHGEGGDVAALAAQGREAQRHDAGGHEGLRAHGDDGDGHVVQAVGRRGLDGLVARDDGGVRPVEELVDLEGAVALLGLGGDGPRSARRRRPRRRGPSSRCGGRGRPTPGSRRGCSSRCASGPRGRAAPRGSRRACAAGRGGRRPCRGSGSTRPAGARGAGRPRPGGCGARCRGGSPGRAPRPSSPARGSAGPRRGAGSAG